MLDDAVTNYTTTVTDHMPIARVDVGLRVDHPRVSDLAVTLISPNGTRVLLVENRGGTTTNGLGSSLTVTNFTPVSPNGSALPQTNIVDTGSTVGSATVNYNFYEAADRMTIYYDGATVPIYDTGLINGSGRFTINYGPGSSTLLEIRMNEVTTTNSSAWDYTISSYNTANSYLVFTDNTNLTTTPIKFALPPYAGLGGTNYLLSDFELPTVAQDYVGPTVGVPDGWSVINSNTVTVVTNPPANTFSNSLALRSGVISRDIATTPGRSYRVGYVYRKVPNLNGMISWWRADNNAVDSIDGNHGTLAGNAGYAAGLV
ncbi:MAG: proprotein convertase P-domain-containing protein [Verrucomicrobiota bacterium]